MSADRQPAAEMVQPVPAGWRRWPTRHAPPPAASPAPAAPPTVAAPANRRRSMPSVPPSSAAAAVTGERLRLDTGACCPAAADARGSTSRQRVGARVAPAGCAVNWRRSGKPEAPVSWCGPRPMPGSRCATAAARSCSTACCATARAGRCRPKPALLLTDRQCRRHGIAGGWCCLCPAGRGRRGAPRSAARSAGHQGRQAGTAAPGQASIIHR